jgi:hypothetical protein
LISDQLYGILNLEFKKRSKFVGKSKKVVYSDGKGSYQRVIRLLQALERAGFTDKVVDQVINSPDNQMASLMYAACAHRVEVDRKPVTQPRELTGFEWADICEAGTVFVNLATALADWPSLEQVAQKMEERGCLLVQGRTPEARKIIISRLLKKARMSKLVTVDLNLI